MQTYSWANRNIVCYHSLCNLGLKLGPAICGQERAVLYAVEPGFHCSRNPLCADGVGRNGQSARMRLVRHGVHLFL